MNEQAWTWLLFGFEIVGITGMYAVGLRKWWGWAIVLGHSIPWAIYSLTYGKTGFAAMTILWWTVNSVNMVKWRRQQPSPTSADGSSSSL